MPYTRRRRTYPKTRRYRTTKTPRVAYKTRPRRRYYKAANVFRQRWKNPIPQTAYIKWKYTDTGFDGSCTSIGAYQNLHFFRGNSIYDPDGTGAGVQPYGFDQVGAVFSSYRVTASSITINYSITDPISSGTGTQVKVYLVPSRQAAPTYSDPSDLRMTPYCRWKMTSIATGTTGKNWLRAYCSTRKLHKFVDPNDIEFGAGTAANPNSQWFWLVIFDTSDAAEAVSISYEVKITYYTIMNKLGNTNES